MGVLSKVRSWFGAPYAPGGYGFTPPASWPISWWQQGFRMPNNGGNAAVEACVGAISQTIASLPLSHWRTLPNGGKEEILNSPASKVLRRPNSYQTRADFVLNLLRTELMTGNSIAVAARNDRRQIESLHLLPSYVGQPFVSPEDQSIYYLAAHHDLLPEPPIDRFWPARDVLHIRLHTPRHPLVGESPITAAMMAVTAGNAVQGHLASFFTNMSRPSGYLTSPKPIKQDTAEKLRAMWERAYSAGEGSGKIAVLQEGLEWRPLTINSVDSQLIESYRLTIADIARVYRVPLSVIGELGGSTFNNTETLIRHWLSTGLGFIVEHVELALDRLFELPDDEYISFDVEYLLRADFMTRISGLTKGVVGGLFSPNEARNREGLPSVKFGDEPRLQAQVVPLSAVDKIKPAPSAPASTAPPISSGKKTQTVEPTVNDYLKHLRRGTDAAA